MLLAVILLALAALLASGALFAHQRWLTYLATAGTLLEAQWLGLTLLDRTLMQTTPTATVFTLGSLVLLAVALLLVRQWQWPALAVRREAVGLAVTALVAAAAGTVVWVNGFTADGSWTTHGFYNGDTMTFISLVQRSLLTDGLVRSNPFAGGGPLEYPTLVHAAWATVLERYEPVHWLDRLPVITLIQTALTVPLFFLLWDVVHPEPKEGWRKWLGVPRRGGLHLLQGGMVLYVLALSWDGYVYPQSHFFITGLFILAAALWSRVYNDSTAREIVWVVPASAITLVLLLANAVSGTAAVALAVTFCVLRAADRTREVWQRVPAAVVALGWVLLLVLLPPGRPDLGGVQFPYTATGSMLLLAPALLAVISGVWLSWRRQETFVGAAAVVLTLLAFITFFGSSREIVAENASRFVYHAVIVGMVLWLAPMIRLFYWLRQKLWLEEQPVSQLAILYGSLMGAAVLTMLPALAGVASAHDHLMRQDRQVVSGALQEAVAWIAKEVPAEAVVAASAQQWAVPLFSGRALLRADYWLSPRDELLADINNAYAGDGAAQKRVMQKADFLLLTDDEQPAWATDNFEAVFRNKAAAIFRL